MFYATVSSYARDKDGRERRFNKSFANPDEYKSFLSENPQFSFERTFSPARLFGFDPTFEFETPLLDTSERVAKEALPEGINLDRYAEAAREIEQESRRKAEKKSQLQAAKERLGSYLERFKAAGKSDMVASVESDLEKIDKEMAAIA